MQICICDDDTYTHDAIKNLLSQQDEVPFHITDIFSGEELITEYQSGNTFDIVFLDIEMNKLNGIKAAEQIREIVPNAIIIFVSNYPSYVFDVFRLEALHFIVKPVNPTEFYDVFQRAINKYRSLHSTIAIRWQNERTVITINDIFYVEGYKRHITVHTRNDEYEMIGKIKDTFEILEPHGFIRIHQGYIVNMNYIKRFDTNDVILCDNTKVMISVRKRAEALKAYDTYLQKWKW